MFSAFARRCRCWCLLLLFCLWSLASIDSVAHAASFPAPVARALKAADIPPSAVAVVVQAVEARSPRLAVNAEVAMNPASTLKLLTTFAALDTLGPAFTWQTEAYAENMPVAGVLNGDLYLRGSGDPALTYERFGDLLRALRLRGVREIRGDLVLDRGAFAAASTDPGAFDNAPTRPYNVLPDALLVNFNALTLQLQAADEPTPGVMASEPPLANLDLVNQLRLAPTAPCTDDWTDNLQATTATQGDRLRLVVSGVYPAACGERRWHVSPADHNAFVLGVFKQLWTELGGRFAGTVREGQVPAALQPNARQLAVLSSPTLGEIVRDINKYSNNVMARQLFLTLGLAAGHRPASAADGEAAVRAWLARRQLELPGLVLENGAGLSRTERISAIGMARLLQAAWRSATMPELMASLPIAGIDGTLKKHWRQDDLLGQAHLKTGSLDGVRAVAGYLLDKNGRRWIVVALVNHPKAAAARPALEALLHWVWAGRR